MEMPISREALDKLDLTIKHNPRVISSLEGRWVAQELRSTFPKAATPEAQSETFLPDAKAFTVKLERIPSQAAIGFRNEIAALGGSAFVLPEDGLIASATQSQFQKLATDAKDLGPFPGLVCDCLARYEEASFLLPCRTPQGDAAEIELSAKHTGVMGILNVTPDSFSDGARFCTLESAVERAHRMALEGAAIIDIGGESTRPKALPVSADEEKRRTVPVIERLAEEMEAPISIDTRKADVAEEAIQAGAGIVNDVGGLRDDPRMAEVVAKSGVAVVIMHKKGAPQNMQDAPHYADLMSEITRFLRESIRIALAAGVEERKILIDPGIGFGKSVEDNLEILDRLSEFRSLGRPILIGASRKSTIGHILDAPVDRRLTGSLASAAVAISNGARVVRVHDVEETVQLVKVCNAIASARKA